jgi:hypothetical protein
MSGSPEPGKLAAAAKLITMLSTFGQPLPQPSHGLGQCRGLAPLLPQPGGGIGRGPGSWMERIETCLGRS